MKKLILCFVFATAVVGCARTPANITSSPIPSATSHPVPQSPPLPMPPLPKDWETFLKPARTFTQTDSQTAPWWTESKVKNNKLALLMSELPPAELEKRLQPLVAGENRVARFDGSPYVELKGTRLGLFAKKDDAVALLLAISSTESLPKPPMAWGILEVPVPEFRSEAEKFEGQKSLLVVAEGEGLAEYVEQRIVDTAVIKLPPSQHRKTTPTPAPTSKDSDD